jgi:hypothetical protein
VIIPKQLGCLIGSSNIKIRTENGDIGADYNDDNQAVWARATLSRNANSAREIRYLFALPHSSPAISIHFGCQRDSHGPRFARIRTVQVQNVIGFQLEGVAALGFGVADIAAARAQNQATPRDVGQTI